MWLYFPAENLSHSEGTWLNDCILRNEFYRIVKGPDYVIILSSQKSIPFWGDLTMWLYFSVKNLSHSEENWLCDYTFQPNIYPILRGPDYVIIISYQKSIPFWGDLTGIVTYGMKSITFWGDLTMWLYFPAQSLSHSEGTWLNDCILRNEFYRILKGPDYVIMLSSQNSIPFWGDLTVIVTYGMKSITFGGDLTIWLYFHTKSLSHSEGTWLWL